MVLLNAPRQDRGRSLVRRPDGGFTVSDRSPVRQPGDRSMVRTGRDTGASRLYFNSDRNPFNRRSGSDGGSPLSQEMRAMGGYGAVVSEQRRRSEAFLTGMTWATNPDGSMKQFVGIENPAEWARTLQAPWLGSAATWGTDAMRFQLPEYETWEVAAELDQMSPQELRDFRAAAIRAGLYEDSDFPPSDSGRSPSDLRAMALLMARVNSTPLQNWRQALSELVANPSIELDGTSVGASGEGPTGPQTTRSIIYQSTSREAGRSILRNQMRELLGREPTDSEVSEYVAALNREEQRRPQIIEAVTEMGDNENETTTTQRLKQDSPEPQEFLREQVEDDNEGEKFTYQAQGYFARLMDII
jgi:hypothetical protein